MSMCCMLRFVLLLGLTGSLTALDAQERSLPQQISDQEVLLYGGIHPGYRFEHAKGLVVLGTFTAAPTASSVSRAPHLQGGAVPVTVRFSDGPGVPNIPDTDPAAAPRGLAIRFGLSGGAFTDIVAISHNGFVVGTGEDFLAFLKALVATRPDSPHPWPVEAFLGSHPRSLKFVMDLKPLPESFATLAYYGNTAFVFVDAKGTKRAGRYQIIPVAGLATLDSAAAAKAGPNYLFDDLPRRLARGAVQFRLYVQLANPGDQTNDASIVWPDDRRRVELGTISLTTVAANNAELQRSLTYNPIYLTPGIELSDDPLVPLRSAAYALSVQHRRSTDTPPATAAAGTATAGGRAPIVVQMLGDASGYRFDATTITVHAGDVVRFVNASGGPHNVSFWADSVPRGSSEQLQQDMGPTIGPLKGVLLLEPNAPYQVAIAKLPAGTYKYYCLAHLGLGMRGEIVVQP